MIYGICGDMGSGKTLLMVYLLYKAHKQGKRIISNVKLPFGEMLDFRKILNEKQGLENCTIGIDESHMFMDSRLSMSTFSRLLYYFISQSRKRHVNLFYTTQRLRTTDIRLESATHYFIRCVPYCYTDDPNTKRYLMNKEGERTKGLVHVNGCIRSPDRILLYRKDCTKEYDTPFREWKMFKTKPFFDLNLYDTDQIIDESECWGLGGNRKDWAEDIVKTDIIQHAGKTFGSTITIKRGSHCVPKIPLDYVIYKEQEIVRLYEIKRGSITKRNKKNPSFKLEKELKGGFLNREDVYIIFVATYRKKIKEKYFINALKLPKNTKMRLNQIIKLYNSEGEGVKPDKA